MQLALKALQAAKTSAEHSTAHNTHTPYWDMLPHHRITNYDVTLPNVLISI